ncbi:hypothetical protein PanWU01x14_168480 [Parasponia andersonii]|uniref:Transmembrane protein n=1 Tax=Parasponia andersonii TaxID=3476 RepID=A0A2P5CB19_PARAD|nr:hypothetical protein PanWU01x14_168480 [Parasponia andersonii]
MSSRFKEHDEEYGTWSPQELKEINGRQEKRVRRNRTKAEILTGTHVLLQTLFLNILSVLSSSSSTLESSHKWLVLLGLILISSVIFFLAYFDAVITFYRTQFELDMNNADLEVLMLREKKYQQKDYYPERSRRPDVVQLYKRKFYIYFVTSALIAFTALELYACRLFLRRV